MGSIGGLLGTAGGVNGTGFGGPSAANLVNPTNPGQITTAYNAAQQGLAGQQNLLAALQAQNGLANQSNVYNQLQNVAAGQGPNPAKAQLAQATGQNIASQGALQAGQRGANANVGLMSRNIAQQGANTQQQAVGQGATMQAQQSLNALNSLGSMATTQAGQQIGQTNSVSSAQQAEQQNLLNAQQGYNSAQMGMQSNINNVNGQLANTTMQGQQAMLGGFMNGVSSIMAKGGVVKRYDDGGQVSPFGSFQGSTTNNSPDTSSDVGSIFSGGKGAVGKFASSAGKAVGNSIMGNSSGAAPAVDTSADAAAPTAADASAMAAADAASGAALGGAGAATGAAAGAAGGGAGIMGLLALLYDGGEVKMYADPDPTQPVSQSDSAPTISASPSALPTGTPSNAPNGAPSNTTNGATSNGPTSKFGKFLKASTKGSKDSTEATPNYGNYGANALAKGMQGLTTGAYQAMKPTPESPNVPINMPMAGGPQDTTNAPATGPDTVQAAKGGKVPALVSPGEIRIHKKDVPKIAKGEKSPLDGQKIGGIPNVPGSKNSYKNDTVPMDLNEGDIILPRSVTQSKHPHWAAHKFVSAIMAKNGGRIK
jgi:hypothetical protein